MTEGTEKRTVNYYKRRLNSSLCISWDRQQVFVTAFCGDRTEDIIFTMESLILAQDER